MKKIICLMISMIVMTSLPRVKAAEEGKGIETVISFELTAENRFIYEVKVSEGGCLYDGSKKITNGIMAYELSVGEIKKFSIEADKGYEVKYITINGENTNPKQREIQVTGVSADSILEVRYGKIEAKETDEPASSIKPNISSQLEKSRKVISHIPSTGDIWKMGEYVCLLILMLCGMYISKRGINTSKIVEDINQEKRKIKEEQRDERKKDSNSRSRHDGSDRDGASSRSYE